MLWDCDGGDDEFSEVYSFDLIMSIGEEQF